MTPIRSTIAALAALAASLFAVPVPANAADGDAFDSWSIGPDTFYPLVSDGYRDAVEITWDSKVPATTSVSIEVTDASSGEPVRSFTASGSGTQNWYGYRTGGARASEGDYIVTLTGTDTATGAKEVQTSRVTLASGFRTVHTVKGRVGDNPTYTDSRGRCAVNVFTRLDQTVIDCYGLSSYARGRANYRFYVPEDATDVEWSVDSTRGCCYPGTVDRWASRIGSYVRVKVRATYKASATINSVSLEYDRRVAI